MTWDVVVSGAGPAGAIAGVILARAGARVLLLDRARFPRPKLCGDTVNPGALSVLRRLQLESAVMGGIPIRGMLVTGEPAVSVRGLYPDGVAGVSVERSTLDVRLVDAAAAAGATVDDGRLVRRALVDADGTRAVGVEAVRGSGGERIHARIVIAADGHHSRLARQLGLCRAPAAPRRWAIGAYVENVRGLSDCGEMHVRAGRYLGVSPMRGGLANVCLVTADRGLLRLPGQPLHALSTDPQLADRFASARMAGRSVVLGPLALEASAAGMPGLLLAGDAAGFIDPMTGDGLRFAFEGGALAADEALRALVEGPDAAHERLAVTRRRAFRTKWRFNRALRALVGSAPSVRMAAASARLAPAVLARAIRYAGDVG